MARTFTKFTIGPSGELVYKKTGKLAPKGYTFRKNTVYGLNGRKIGTLSRNLSKAEQTRIKKAADRRAKASRKPAMPKPGKPKAPSRRQRRAAAEQTTEEFESDVFKDEYEEAVIEDFQRRVREAALSVQPPSLRQKIIALPTKQIWLAYQQDQYIFEVYFRYHAAGEEPHRSDVSVWLYQFVHRIEQYMDVEV